jgi:chaperonin GroEL
MLAGQEARAALLRGALAIERLVRPTLGPLGRTVLVSQVTGGAPESLDSGATLARRIYQIDPRPENAGAMLMRHLAWRVHERVGDGSATAVVIAGELLRRSIRAVEAGLDPIGIQRGIRGGLDAALEFLRAQARPVDDRPTLERLVGAALADPPLAAMVAEVIDSVGADGAVLVEESPGTRVEHEYVDGARWNSGWLSSSFCADGSLTVRLTDPRILLADMPVESPMQLVATLEACIESGARELVVIAPSMTDSALSLLLLNRERGVLSGVLAIQAPSHGTGGSAILHDLAALTGGHCVDPAAGDRLERVTADDLGSARQVWATRTHFGVIGGRGDRAAIWERIGRARAELRAVTDDDWLRERTRERIGKLSGTTALILVGAPTEAARAERKLAIEAGIAAARAALGGGAVPGGGSALAACSRRLHCQVDVGTTAERAGREILAASLVAPSRALASNAGFQSRREVPGRTFDVLRGEWVDSWADGPLDSLAVLEAGLSAAVSLASTVLTSEVLLTPRTPPTSTEP